MTDCSNRTTTTFSAKLCAISVFGNCKLYLSSVIDLYNREIVAYTISDCQDTNFVLDTLNQLELPKGALLHRDQSSV